jgi:hypothetical protein
MAVISNFPISNKQEQRMFIRGQKFPRDEHAPNNELLAIFWL